MYNILLHAFIVEAYNKKFSSRNDFYEMLKEARLSPYVRGGRVSDVAFNNKKFRLNRLEFTDERLLDLDVAFNRSKELSGKRENAKEKVINRRR